MQPPLLRSASRSASIMAFFVSAFGRRQWREHSRHYLQALLVQSQERRNAENLAEAVSVSARALQRFLTDARWDDERVLRRLQAYLGPRLQHPQAVWVLDGSDFPKQGRKSVGVARQYCGILGKIANCQAGLFLAHVGPRGRALVDKRLYLPAAWCADAPRCAAARVPAAQQRYRAENGFGAGNGGAGAGAGPSGGPMGGRGCGLRHVALLPGRSGGGRPVVRPGCELPHDRVAADTHLERPSLSGLGPLPHAHTAAWAAAHSRGAQPGLAARRVAGGDRGAGRARPPNLPLPRAAGARHRPAPAGAGGLAPPPPTPGWQRAALLSVQRPGGDAAGDAGLCERVQVAH